MTARDAKALPSAIPRPWREAVRGILLRRYSHDIQVTDQATRDWQAVFKDAYMADLYGAIEHAMADEALEGRLVADIRPPGEAYEFMFHHRDVLLYGKVNLVLPHRRLVIVVSAHRPYKGDRL